MCGYLQFQQYAIHIKIFFKQMFQQLIVFKVDIYRMFKTLRRKLFHQPRLSYLSCSLQDKRFTVRLMHPCFQLINSVSYHIPVNKFHAAKVILFFESHKDFYHFYTKVQLKSVELLQKVQLKSVELPHKVRLKSVVYSLFIR